MDLAPGPEAARLLQHAAVSPRRDPVWQRRRRRLDHVREHDARTASLGVERGRVERPRALGDGDDATLRDRTEDARRHPEPDPRRGRRDARGDGEGSGRRCFVLSHRRRGLLRQARRRGSRSLLRRRRPRSQRLQRLRRLHGRLPVQCEEHARQELPLPRREARRAGDGRDARRRHRAARHRRQRRLSPHRRALDRVVREAPPHGDRAPRRARRLGARHDGSADEDEAARLLADIIPAGTRKPINVERIQALVADYYNVDPQFGDSASPSESPVSLPSNALARNAGFAFAFVWLPATRMREALATRLPQLEMRLATMRNQAQQIKTLPRLRSPEPDVGSRCRTQRVGTGLSPR